MAGQDASYTDVRILTRKESGIATASKSHSTALGWSQGSECAIHFFSFKLDEAQERIEVPLLRSFTLAAFNTTSTVASSLKMNIKTFKVFTTC